MSDPHSLHKEKRRAAKEVMRYYKQQRKALPSGLELPVDVMSALAATAMTLNLVCNPKSEVDGFRYFDKETVIEDNLDTLAERVPFWLSRVFQAHVVSDEFYDRYVHTAVSLIDQKKEAFVDWVGSKEFLHLDLPIWFFGHAQAPVINQTTRDFAEGLVNRLHEAGLLAYSPEDIMAGRIPDTAAAERWEPPTPKQVDAARRILLVYEDFGRELEDKYEQPGDSMWLFFGIGGGMGHIAKLVCNPKKMWDTYSEYGGLDEVRAYGVRGLKRDGRNLQRIYDFIGPRMTYDEQIKFAAMAAMMVEADLMEQPLDLRHDLWREVDTLRAAVAPYRAVLKSPELAELNEKIQAVLNPVPTTEYPSPAMAQIAALEALERTEFPALTGSAINAKDSAALRSALERQYLLAA